MNTPLLTREAAVAYCQGLGLTHVTVQHLKKLAAAGKGPRYSRMGKYVYYAREDVDWWIQRELRPVPRAA